MKIYIIAAGNDGIDHEVLCEFVKDDDMIIELEQGVKFKNSDQNGNSYDFFVKKQRNNLVFKKGDTKEVKYKLGTIQCKLIERFLYI